MRYLLVGGYNTVFGYGLFAAAEILLGSHVHYLLILVVCQVIATINAYVTYRVIVFRPEGHVVRDFFRFSAVYCAALLANVVVLPLLVHVGLGVLVAQALVVAATVVASYLAHKHFSFRRPLGPSAQADVSENAVA